MTEEMNISLDWEVESQKLYNSKGESLKDYRILTRSDTGALLNVCKKSYQPVPNALFKKTVNDMSKLTGFELKGFVEGYGGKKLFAYLKSDGQKMGGFDFDNYMVIGNSHDYSSGFFIGTVHNMVRCQNRWGIVKKGAMYSIPHTKSSETKIEDLILSFETYQEDMSVTKRNLDLWKEIDIDQNLREMMIERVLRIELGNEDCSTRTKNKIEALNSSIEMEMADIGENALGLFQGITHYTTHVMNQKNRVFGNLLGQSYDINRRAMDFCNFIVDGTIENLDLN